MPRYIFFLGISPTLGKREVVDVLRFQGIKPRHVDQFQSWLLVETTKRVDLKSVQERLGGTIKIGLVLSNPVSNQEALDQIKDRLAHKKDDKITFSLFGSFDDRAADAFHIKQSLDKPARFVDSTYWHGISPEYSAEKDLYEFGLIFFRTQVYLVEIMAISDTKGFRMRDLKRPAVQTSEGIMPPKLSRMLVNIALSNTTITNPTVVDPFCGSGTILAEALSLGCEVRGMDLSQEALDAARVNLKAVFPDKDVELTKGDVTVFEDLSKVIDANSIVVTESYLGPVTPDYREYGSIADELYQLHQTWLNKLYSLISKGSVTILVLPDYHHSISDDLTKKVIDAATNSGYTLLLRPTKYRQKTAAVGRTILGIQK